VRPLIKSTSERCICISIHYNVPLKSILLGHFRFVHLVLYDTLRVKLEVNDSVLSQWLLGSCES
jgi:hypothetical protein